MPSFNIWILASITVMSAGVIQSLTGFGFGLVSVPFLLMLFPSRQAVLISMVLSLCSLLMQGVRSRKLVNWIFVRQLIIIGLPGLICGIILGDFLNSVIVKGIVGVTLIFYVSFQWLLVEKQRKAALLHNSNTVNSVDSEPIYASSHKEKETSKPKGFYLAGIFSGLLTGIAGLPGPPVIAVLINAMPKEKFRATIVWYFIIEYILAISAFLLLKHAEQWVHTIVWDILLLLVPTIIGYLSGVPLRKVLSETHFKRLVFGLLLVVGFTSSWDALNLF